MIYSTEVLRKFSNDALNILQDTIVNPAFHIHEVNNVKYDYANLIEKNKKNAEVTIQEDIHEAAYGKEGLGLPFHASRETLDNISSKSLLKHVERFYTPDRMVVAAVNIGHDEFVRQVDQYFGSMIKGNVGTQNKQKYLGNEFRVHSSDSTEFTHISIGLETANWHSEDLVPMCVLHTMLGGGGTFSAGGPGKGMYSRLYLNVLNRYHWIQSCNVFNSIHTDSGLFGIYGVATPDYSDKLAEVIVSELKGMANPELLSKEELNRAKNALRSSILMNLENRTIKFEDIGRQLLTYGRKIPDEEIVERINKTTAEDVLAAASKMLKTKPTIVIRGNTTSIPYYPILEKEFKFAQ